MKVYGRGQFVQLDKLKMYNKKKNPPTLILLIYLRDQDFTCTLLLGFFKNPFTEILRWLVVCCFDSTGAYFTHIVSVSGEVLTLASASSTCCNPGHRFVGVGFFNDKTTSRQGTNNLFLSVSIQGISGMERNL